MKKPDTKVNNERGLGIVLFHMLMAKHPSEGVKWLDAQMVSSKAAFTSHTEPKETHAPSADAPRMSRNKAMQ